MTAIFRLRNEHRLPRFTRWRFALGIAGMLMLSVLGGCENLWSSETALKGYDITPTGLKPSYPKRHTCSPITSPYATWLDIDGTERDAQHSGIDIGKLNDTIIAPAPGRIKAVWRANWGWGLEGALLIEHTREDLNMKDGAEFYYSAYDHLKFDEIKAFEVGETITRGEELAHVYRPGGLARYLPEVHFEVWESEDDELKWVKNGYGGREWRIGGARLVDPLYMMSLERRPLIGKTVSILPFIEGKDYRNFRGFTYPLKCPKMKAR